MNVGVPGYPIKVGQLGVELEIRAASKDGLKLDTSRGRILADLGDAENSC
jgi:hypothetical protein